MSPIPDALRPPVELAFDGGTTAAPSLARRLDDDSTDARRRVGARLRRLEWRGWAPDRVMPWYCCHVRRIVTHAYGVRTGAKLVLFLAGGSPRRQSVGGCAQRRRRVSSWATARWTSARSLPRGTGGRISIRGFHAFCREMCANPRIPCAPVYGSNDWYWAYGKNSAETVRADAAAHRGASPRGANRPFAVIDDGWQPGRGAGEVAVPGRGITATTSFRTWPGLAAAIRRAGARPGIWIRPLLAPPTRPTRGGFRARDDLDPTVPEVRQKVSTTSHESVDGATS